MHARMSPDPRHPTPDTRASEAIAFAWRDLHLAGTLHLPATPPPHPAVLMLQGSGPADRDSDGYFPPIRDAFLSRGIAAFSFDKPGLGGSSGDWRQYALEDRADQARAAIAVLHAHAAIDSRRVGVWGQSQGGWLVQMLASRLPALAFAIANSGAAIGVEPQDLANCEQTMRAEGKSEGEIASALHFIRALHMAAESGADFETVERQLLVSARAQPWYGYGLTVDDASDWGLTCRFVQEHYEPADALAQVRCPFLAIFGERDTLAPAWESAKIYGSALRTAACQDATIVVFPQGNHRILGEETGQFVPGYLDLLADWTARRVGHRPCGIE
jgi:pimeloyl-ACP methyl ester carboxylesterase